MATAYAIAGWLIIQISDTVFPRIGLPEWTVTFVIAITTIGFPIALIIAWAFELTPDGLKKTAEVEVTESVTQETGKKINRIAIISLSLVIVLLIGERVFFADAPILSSDDSQIENASIAVLPFVNMSQDASNEYFSDGLSEELLNGLAKVEGMQVAGRTSSFSFKGKNEDLRNIAQELGVKHILEGSVRKDGNRIRITAQLIQADNGFHLWSETYDRELDSIFEIQDDISRQVVNELKIRLLPEEEIQILNHPTEDIEAYNAYLAANQVGATRRAADLERAIELYQQAIRLDPGFSEAYARLAFTYQLLHENGDLPVEEMKALMRLNIDKALALDEDLAFAYKAEAGLQSFNLDSEKRKQSARKAYELAPNDAEIVNTYYISLGDDQIDEKYRMLEKAYRLDPLSAPIATNYANYLMLQKSEFEKAGKILDNMIERYPDYAASYQRKAWLLRDVPYGELDKAFEFAYKAYLRNPDNLELMYLVSDIARDVDLKGVPEYMAERGISLYPNNNSGYRNKLRNLLFAGKLDEAEAILDQFIETYGERVKTFFRLQYSYMYYTQGEFQKGLDILKIGPNIEVYETGRIENDGQAANVRFYITLLKQMDRQSEVERWKDEVERYLSRQIQSWDDSEDYNKLVSEFDLSMLMGDFEKSAELLEIMHFEYKSKANWPVIFTVELPYFEFKESPYYPEIRQRIDEDLASMRSNIINYLKSEGEWNDEWDALNELK